MNRIDQARDTTTETPPSTQEFVRNFELNKYVASSTGALQIFCEHCEVSILNFGYE